MKFNFLKSSLIVEKFQDFRGLDLSDKNFKNVSLDVLKTINFDSQTKWPNKEKLPTEFNLKDIFENSKNPGLGLRELHNSGITGANINVAIIDQKLDVHHNEYSQKILSYEEVGKINEKISMHGPSVASLLVGKNCGIVPESKLYYIATPSGKNCNWNNQTTALNKIMNRNKSLSEKEKIKVVSCSLGYPNQSFGGSLSDYKKAINEVRKSGVILVDANIFFELGFTGGGSIINKDDPDTYEKWLFTQESKSSRNSINDKVIIPSDYRTVASSWNKKDKNTTDEYAFYGRGGVSWSIPYLAGIFALMLQTNKDLTMIDMIKLLKNTSTLNKIGLRVINPKIAIKKSENFKLS